MTSSTSPIHVVITGFEPFGDHAYNPSWDAASAMAEALGARPHLLSVTYSSAAQFARAHLETRAHDPGSRIIFVHLGLAARRDHLAFEERAINRRDHIPDNAERPLNPSLPPEQPLIADDLPRRHTQLPLPRLREHYELLRDADPDLPPSMLSQDCGSYVCNALLYHSLRAAEAARSRGVEADALFIHLPPLSPDAARRTGRALAKSFIALFDDDLIA
ncbi:hypothetical protein EA187_07750 [Lujinxingia sediminis]|uniref:Pyrrolidone-carboxylate peptidase n=1 Tax=Lujinxingia sediminis TaxID=2480984 RepID=A0ABY0CVF5_9DELT|nr:hypothetical protein [Lujinxingia sediminis]RVU47016.1 hypothetical protein EA187_07750 [Lujinxingia sediminis]